MRFRLEQREIAGRGQRVQHCAIERAHALEKSSLARERLDRAEQRRAHEDLHADALTARRALHDLDAALAQHVDAISRIASREHGLAVLQRACGAEAAVAGHAEPFAHFYRATKSAAPLTFGG